MEPHDAIGDWQRRMASLAAEAAGYSVRGIDGQLLGSVQEVRAGSAAGPLELLVRPPRLPHHVRRIAVELVRAVDPARRTVVLAVGLAAFERLPRQTRAVPDPDPSATAESPSGRGHLLFVPESAAYVLRAMPGREPAVGDAVAIERRSYVVAKVGASPLPGDDRRCAYLI